MITKEQYGEWRNHPATQFYRQFLKDRAQSLITGGSELWLNAPESFLATHPERRARILQLLECEDVSFDLIQAFYQERDNGIEDPQAVSR